MTILVLVDAPTQADVRRGRLFSGEYPELLTKALKDEDVPYRVVSLFKEPIEKKKLGKRDLEHFAEHLPLILDKYKTVILVGAMPFQAVTGGAGVSKASGRPIEKDGVVYLPCVSPYAAAHDDQVAWKLKTVALRAREINDFGGVPYEHNIHSVLVEDEASIKDMLKALTGDVSFDIETNALYPWQTHNDKGEPDPAQVMMIGFGTEEAQWHILAPGHPLCKLTQDQYSDLIERIDETIARNRVQLITHNGKFDFLWMKVHSGVNWYEHQAFDTMLAHYLLDENSRHGLKELAQRFCGAPNWDVDKDTKRGVTPSLDKFILYHAHDLYYTRELKIVLDRMFQREPRVRQVFDEILMPCSRIFTEIEYNGLYIDVTKFDQAENYLLGELKAAEERLKEWGDINWGSASQLGKLLYGKPQSGGLGIRCPVRTPAGGNSTSESALNQIDHPCITDLLKYRGAKQQLSFFIEGWKPYLHKRKLRGETHFYLHPSFKLHGTVTGRLSCQHPNMQQIPRDPRIRSLITAPPGWTLIECDLSQIELRIAAALAGERAMIEAFQRGEDVHWKTALREIERGGGGGHAELINETATMFLMSVGLPPNGTGSKVLLNLWDAVEKDPKSGEKLQLAYKEWLNSKPGNRERGKSTGREQSILERWKPYMGKEVSKELLRAVREYEACVLASQGREPTKQSRVEFTDALSILSCAGPSCAQDFKAEWKELRKKAKAVSFGFLYGMFWKKFKQYARDNYGVEVTDEQAQASREFFFSTYSGFPEWHKRQKRIANRDGFIETLTGRRRRLPDAMSHDDSPARGAAERQAINSPVQSLANEINLMSAIQLRKEYGLDKVKLCGTVHDAILAMVKNEYVEEVFLRLMEIMKRPELMDTFNINLAVPIEADGKIGPWSTGVSLEKWKCSR